MDISQLDVFKNRDEISELIWYLYDIINEVTAQDGIKNSEYSLDREQEGKVCLTWKEGELFVCGKFGEDIRRHQDFYHGVCDFFNRLCEHEEEAERVLSLFLTRTIDLPGLMKKPSQSKLKAELCRCQKEIEYLEAQIKKEPGKKEETKLALNRIYLRGLREKLERYYGNWESE